MGKGQETIPKSERRKFKEFWKSVIGVKGEYTGEDKYIKRWKESKGSIERSEFPSFTETTWLKIVQKCKNWRAPGPDGI